MGLRITAVKKTSAGNLIRAVDKPIWVLGQISQEEKEMFGKKVHTIFGHVCEKYISLDNLDLRIEDLFYQNRNHKDQII